nr:hypothetical protein [uncultured bacterium]
MSSNTHLRPEAGGDPARSNSTDLKNDPKAPQDANDFPDAPEHKTDEQPQDKPDLDAFAKRMGTDTIETGDGLDAVPEHRTAESNGIDSRMIIAGGGAVVAALLLIVFRRRKQRGLMEKAVALGAAAHVIRD